MLNFTGPVYISIRATEVLAALDKLQQTIEQLRTTLMGTLQDIIDAVNAEKTVDDSAIALLNGLTAKIQELINAQATPEQFQAVVDQITSNAAALSAAVTANTPAAPPAP